jgi:hypothetical protein
MTNLLFSDEFTFDRNREYRIVVQGSLDDSWSDRLGGMHITRNIRAGQEPVTTLTGPLRDQAELSGVLNTLYDLHLTLLSLETVNAK